MTEREMNQWQLIYHHWQPQEQALREALCTLGNGYFATRGAAEEMDAGGPHYPGTYLAGGYNRLESNVSGRVIENEDLVNWPNWLCLSFRLEGEPWFDLSRAELLTFRQVLDVRHGVLERELRVRDSHNRVSSLRSRRLVHMAEPHLAAMQWTLVPENWSGRVEIASGLDGSVINAGVARYHALSSRHLDLLDSGSAGADGIYLSVQTSQSRIVMAQAARTQVFRSGEPAMVPQATTQLEKRIDLHLMVDVEEGQPLELEKVVAIYTSRDLAISEPVSAAKTMLARAPRFDELLATQRLAWLHLWKHADIEIKNAEPDAQLILRLHIFHLLQTTSPHSIDLDVGVPARGLHGEAYRGHIFWDELFIFPFLNLRFPELTRSLLMYRYRRLHEAQYLARREGYAGAMFPWQSGSSGREESQVLHLNPKSGRWVEDHTHRQRHINAAIAYNVWQYYQVSGDIEFLSFYGITLLLEIARFWGSITTFNEQRQRYEICHVVGPDEFHTQYPHSDSVGLNNNAYTNLTAVWAIRCALRALQLVGEDRHDELRDVLNLTADELARWDDITRRMFVPFHGAGIISQFEGYESLEELDWQAYRDKYGDISRLDRILEAEGDSVNRYQASKQADVVMLFHLFSVDELGELLGGLGYKFDVQMIGNNIHYYMQRTSHGSTLSRIVHSWVLARLDRERAYELFRDALASDIEDIQGGTTAEGIHLGAMAGTVDLMQRCHTGIEMRDEVLWLKPCLPDQLHELRLRIRYRGHWLRLLLTHQQLTVTSEKSWSHPVAIGFDGDLHTLDQGDSRTFALQGGAGCS